MHKLPAHFEILVGDLYDTRRTTWEPIRRNYSRHFSYIKSVADLKATLREGAFAWPGGYPLYFITDDGAALSFETVRKEFRRVVYSIRHNLRDGWRVVASQINWEDAELYCAHSGAPISSAYAENR